MLPPPARGRLGSAKRSAAMVKRPQIAMMPNALRQPNVSTIHGARGTPLTFASLSPMHLAAHALARVSGPTRHPPKTEPTHTPDHRVREEMSRTSHTVDK